MNIALIFAGGTGQRMNTRTKPKQFLELHSKPILVYTLEIFQEHDDIDAIVLVMLDDWIKYSWELVDKYKLNKVGAIVAGGSTGQESIYNGLVEIRDRYGEDGVVLIHDGVRPLVDSETITRNIEGVMQNGNAITVTNATETIATKSKNNVVDAMIDRNTCLLAKAPQSFMLKNVLSAHERAISDGNTNFVDSASMMKHYGYELYPVEGTPENIKITTPNDFYVFRALVDAKENSQIFGY